MNLAAPLASQAIADPRLTSWQNVGGCGASSATGSGVGVKWVGRGVRGGSFNVQCQANYSEVHAHELPERHYAVNTLISKEIGDFVAGINLPFVYKYLEDPHGTNIDLSNGGLGDISLQLSMKLGPIGATMLTGTLGLPTGDHDGIYRMKILRQHQQLGFGKLTGSLALDHTFDELWGLVVLGGTAGWRGGENQVHNYRAPSASGYLYTGYYLGPFVPVIGVSATGFAAHDRDQTEDENSGLFVVAGNASLEWSTDWLALHVGVSIPYQYDGVVVGGPDRGPKSPWGWGSWIVAAGLSFSP